MGRARVSHDPKSYSTRLGQRVRELREAKGQTVEQLAAKLRIHAASLYRYESGLRDIPADLYPKLASVLGVKAGGFFPEF